MKRHEKTLERITDDNNGELRTVNSSLEKVRQAASLSPVFMVSGRATGKLPVVHAGLPVN
jgi:hypothetical protein